jgi:hypothetical protein
MFPCLRKRTFYGERKKNADNALLHVSGFWLFAESQLLFDWHRLFFAKGLQSIANGT